MSHSHDEVVAHVPDFYWLIALWSAVHGGEPATEEKQMSDEQVRRAVDGIAAAMAPESRTNKPGRGASADQLRKIGVTGYKPKDAQGVVSPGWCVKVNNGYYCHHDPF